LTQGGSAAADLRPSAKAFPERRIAGRRTFWGIFFVFTPGGRERGCCLDIAAHAGGGKIKDALNVLPLRFFKGLVGMGGGIYRGEIQLLAFKLMNPYDRFFLDYCKLYFNIDDAGFLERHDAFRNWYEYVNHIHVHTA
jgi:hypothetical protein